MKEYALICFISVLFLILKPCIGCSCNVEHPQQKYCQADYVIRATIGKERRVSILDDNSVVVLDQFGRPKREKKEEGDFDNYEASADDREPDGVKPAPILTPENLRSDERPAYIAEANGPDTRIPGFESHFRGINANTLEQVLSQIAPRKKRSTRVLKRLRNRHRLQWPAGLGAPPPPPRVEIQGRQMTQYTITVLKVYKNHNALSGEKHEFLYTPPRPLCNAHLNRKTVYLLMGFVRDGRLEIQLCDYKADLNQLNTTERKNLLHNLGYRFKCGIEECQIQICNHSIRPCPPPNPNPRICYWRNFTTAYHPLAGQFACRYKSRKCSWFNDADKDMTPDSIQY